MTDQPTGPHTPPDGVMRDNDGPPEKIDVSRMHFPIIREHNEPKDGYEPVPLWLASLFGILLFWGGWYVATYNGGFRADVLDENPASLYGQSGDQAGKPVDPVVMGKRLFAGATCVSCHQGNGLGVPGSIPPLAKSEWVLGEPARLKRILLHGLTGTVTVAGATYSSEMPVFGSRLNDQQIAAILTYIRTNSEWGNNASPISPESVAATRAATKDRAGPFTAAELMSVTKDEAPAAPATTQPTTQPAVPATQPAKPTA